jgi:hypothetical protein
LQCQAAVCADQLGVDDALDRALIRTEHRVLARLDGERCAGDADGLTISSTGSLT